MEPFRTGDLEVGIVESDDPPRIFLLCVGRSIEREPRPTLGAFLAGVVTHAGTRGANVELRCQQLTYLNSATIACLVEFIRTCAQHSVRLTIQYDATSAWQRSCFNALQVFAKDDRLTLVEA
ncbi:MAG TPA: hypothetical protein VLB44_18015 [Kofleriaceae bacterium]|nr:hypothetical protein [Kofleriaceae bacterium]